ncbi:type II secretion system protein M [Pseudoalteromonas sp. McH1-7]|uniref:Type II secretion system protein M n=1 Tax=Pseudoalteromonas peptidolytica F12-50-A1 TaxID=1315280 RepID=A0A8I0MXR2_9GAMM|nr:MULTISPECIES: type II secretion system protein M [Pseudoalteromonas]MBE0347766.1 general secretion pathway protein M [Pseudoalteromonas peptidolytica F12-50-A1]MDW7551487.1 type II secretion system protein M [Pseudoalteromonas peptidolytica]NLR16846.1 type II secretion system protein M [Pseudoalteromonas peptidolytica]NUZ13045.1 type II secretion system protein M [Pseudoalteromonas sp. McH1-7]USD28872.1 type II secretion system protein M [Pseudoalteromonas sp. SCSIO 43201]
MKQQVINYWQGLKEQEQKLLIFAGAVFVVFVLVMGIFRPLNQAVNDAELKLQRNHELVNWVGQSVNKLKANSPTRVTSSGSISQVVNSTRSRFKINISKMQPNGDALRLTIDNVEFNQLIAWVDELTNRHGVRVENLDLTQGNTPGFVRVSRLVLEK